MNKFPVIGGSYSFGTIQGDWGSLIENNHIITSRGIIELPKAANGSVDNVLYLSGATLNGQLVMAGQSHQGQGCMLYGLDGKWRSIGVAHGIQMVCFSQDGRWVYCISSGNTGFWEDLITGQHEDFVGTFGVNGIRAVIPPFNFIILGIDTIYSPTYNLNEYVDFENGYVFGQMSDGYGMVAVDGKRYRIRTGDSFANKIMFDGFNIAYGTCDRIAKLSELVFCNIDELEEITTTYPITPIGRPHWLGFFAGRPDSGGGWSTDVDPRTLPGNSYLMIPDNRVYNDEGIPVASYITGSSVEEIESKAQSAAFTPMCYWDGRNWPRWPNLPSDSWLCLQAYCGLNEPLENFERDIENKIIELSQIKPNQKICIVAQCYTSNSSLTTDLKALVPIFSRLAAKHTNVIATIPFSGSGRKTGLQDHPEVRPLWDEFASTITGEPPMEPEPPEPPVPVLPDHVYATLIDTRKKYPTPLGNRGAELINEVSWIHRAEGYGCHNKPGGSNGPQVPGSSQLCSLDIMRTLTHWYDVLRDAEGAGEPVQGEEGDSDDPENWVAPVKPAGVPVPEPTGVVDIIEYDHVCRRSNPKGCLIYFEVQSPNPVVEVTVGLEGDGEPDIVISFSDEPRMDGRYVRALAYKFTVNGTWTLVVTAKDNQGNVYQSNKQQQIQVIP